MPAALAGRVDVMVGVVPYVPDDALHLLPRDVTAHEPTAALDGGHAGLAVLTRTVTASRRWVAPGGWLLLEAGGAQFDPLAGRFEAAGYDSLELLRDGDGDPRALCGRRRPTGGPGPTQASSR